MNAGIKVVLVDTTLNNPAGAVSQISSDNLAGGADAFAAIKQIAPGGGQVLVVNVQPGVSTTDQRTSGFAAAAKADPKYHYVGVQYDQDSASIAAQVTAAALQKNPEHRRHFRDQPVLRGRGRDRRPPGGQVRQGEDRRVRRGTR